MLDPQGKVVSQTLKNMGYENIINVRQGKYFEIELNETDKNKAKKIVEEMTESFDVSPTILDWLGAEIPTNWNGRSLLPIVENTDKKLEPRDYVVFEFDFRHAYFSDFVENNKLAPEECSLAVIRTKEWKYVHFTSLPSLHLTSLHFTHGNSPHFKPRHYTHFT